MVLDIKKKNKGIVTLHVMITDDNYAILKWARDNNYLPCSINEAVRNNLIDFIEDLKEFKKKLDDEIAFHEANKTSEVIDEQPTTTNN
jgi:hypothetical protein